MQFKATSLDVQARLARQWQASTSDGITSAPRALTAASQRWVSEHTGYSYLAPMECSRRRGYLRSAITELTARINVSWCLDAICFCSILDRCCSVCVICGCWCCVCYTLILYCRVTSDDCQMRVWFKERGRRAIVEPLRFVLSLLWHCLTSVSSLNLCHIGSVVTDIKYINRSHTYSFVVYNVLPSQSLVKLVTSPLATRQVISDFIACINCVDSLSEYTLQSCALVIIRLPVNLK